MGRPDCITSSSCICLRLSILPRIKRREEARLLIIATIPNICRVFRIIRIRFGLDFNVSTYANGAQSDYRILANTFFGIAGSRKTALTRPIVFP